MHFRNYALEIDKKRRFHSFAYKLRNHSLCYYIISILPRFNMVNLLVIQALPEAPWLYIINLVDSKIVDVIKQISVFLPFSLALQNIFLYTNNFQTLYNFGGSWFLYIRIHDNSSCRKKLAINEFKLCKKLCLITSVLICLWLEYFI